MKKKIIAIVAFVFICFGSVVFAGQNSNSSTTMQGNNNMSGMSMGHRRGRRHHRRWHRRGRRGNMGSKNSNTE